jgi:hypothetical protein
VQSKQVFHFALRCFVSLGLAVSHARTGEFTTEDSFAPQVFPGKQLGREPLSAEDLAGLAITMADFEAAIGKVQPSVRREGFATTPDVTWDDVGALREVRTASVPEFCVKHKIMEARNSKVVLDRKQSSWSFIGTDPISLPDN